LLSDPFDLDEYVDIKNYIFVKNIMKKYWPGPLTIIFKAKASVPDYMKGHDGTIAFRIPCHEKIRSLVAKTGPLFSTSANLTQEPVPNKFEDISDIISENVECFVGTNQEINIQPSTIIDCSSGKLIMVREGSLSKVDLIEAL
jgi:tRNA threonylcarbamoyl adenosine modification protein (Sua5/YciO/YrdC/YwlC family)